MATITKRYIKGRPYYYAVKCQRVNGKPRLVWQKYLGTAEEIIHGLTEPVSLPKRARLFNYGAPAALFLIAKQLGLIKTVNHIVGKRNQGLSVGEYMTLAAINRCICPRSKRRIGKWYQETILPRLIPASRKQLSSQRFWDNMDHITQAHINEIEKELSLILIEKFGIDLHCLIYDPTNFFTYISTFNEKNKLAQRGRNKQKRTDLRQVNLGLLVSRDFHIPLFHKVYEGNLNDRTKFGSVAEELAERYRLLSKNCPHITIIYDKGNNSQENQKQIDESKYHFVGSLVPSYHPGLLKVPLNNYQPLQGKEFEEGEEAHRTTLDVFGQERTIVVTYSPEFFLDQVKTVSLQIKKKTQRLSDLKEKLSKPYKKGKRASLESVKKKVEQILSGQHMKELIPVKVFKKDSRIHLSYQIDEKAKDNLVNTSFGKTILFTDNHNWNTEEIVLAYRGQSKIEKAFRQMKDPYFVSWYPMFHWTDQKIRVHAFYCVLALTLSSLLQRELARKNILMSIPSIIESLNGIQEIMLLYSPPEKRTSLKKHFIFSDKDKTQELLFQTLGLEQFQMS